MTLSFAPERIETWPLDRLKPYARNAKTHGEDQVAKIAASMAQFGWTVPVLVANDGEVIAGHGRILAATHLGLTDAPVIVLDHLTEAQRRAYRIADNKLTELGAWDEALLAGELQELLAEDFDLSVVGFSDAELDELLAGDGDADGGNEGEDEIPKTPANPVSRPGDLWLLGPHRLLCGDSTVATDVERVLGGVTPLLMIRIVARRADAVTDFGEARHWSETTSFDVLVGEVPNPRPGDRRVLDGEVFIVQGEPVRDRERLVWTLDARPE